MPCVPCRDCLTIVAYKASECPACGCVRPSEPSSEAMEAGRWCVPGLRWFCQGVALRMRRVAGLLPAFGAVLSIEGGGTPPGPDPRRASYHADNAHLDPVAPPDAARNHRIT